MNSRHDASRAHYVAHAVHGVSTQTCPTTTFGTLMVRSCLCTAGTPPSARLRGAPLRHRPDTLHPPAPTMATTDYGKHRLWQPPGISHRNGSHIRRHDVAQHVMTYRLPTQRPLCDM